MDLGADSSEWRLTVNKSPNKSSDIIYAYKIMSGNFQTPTYIQQPRNVSHINREYL